MSRDASGDPNADSVELTERERLIIAIASEAAAHLVSIGAIERRDAIEVISPTPPGRRKTKTGPLTPTEATVLHGLVNGGTNKSIAEDLGISPRTVEVHRTHLREKLGATNSTELAAMALAMGIQREVRKKGGR